MHLLKQLIKMVLELPAPVTQSITLLVTTVILLLSCDLKDKNLQVFSMLSSSAGIITDGNTPVGCTSMRTFPFSGNCLISSVRGKIVIYIFHFLISLQLIQLNVVLCSETFLFSMYILVILYIVCYEKSGKVAVVGIYSLKFSNYKINDFPINKICNCHGVRTSHTLQLLNFLIDG